MTKAEVIRILNQIAELLEIKGESPFKISSYLKGAETLSTMEEDLLTVVNEKRLKTYPGIGKALEEKITSLVKTDSLPYYEELLREIPLSVLEMNKIRGMGPKKIHTLYFDLGIDSIERLEQACRQNELLTLSGFGLKTQNRILKAILEWKRYSGNFLLSEALPVAEAMDAEMQKRLSAGERFEMAGSIRRRDDVMQTLDFIGMSEHPKNMVRQFLSLPQIDGVLEEEKDYANVILESGMGATLHVFSHENFYYQLNCLTGAEPYKNAIEDRMAKGGFKDQDGRLMKDGAPVILQGEEEFFRMLHLEPIPPELQEGPESVCLAEKHQLPNLITMEDVKGILHVHTTRSDGNVSLEDLVIFSIRKGYQYLGISDHSVSAYYARGLHQDVLLRQVEEIHRLQERYPEILILKGVESDILADGSLDYDEDVLDKLDFVIASIHSNFKLSKEDQTKRVIRALENPYTTMLGHMTGRLLLRRPGYELDMERVFETAKEQKTVIELNANPDRLDVDYRYLRGLKEMGVKIAVNPDAHSFGCFHNMIYGILMARKGFLEKDDVINAMDRTEIEQFLKRRKEKNL